MQNANGNETHYGYDQLGRTVAITNALGHATRYTYNGLGNVMSVTDAEGNTTHNTYDNLNRPIETRNALDGTTLVSYDGLGNRLTTTDANDHTTTYVYDDLNRLVQTIDPNSLTTVTTYDGLGNRRTVTNGESETIEFDYDQANRLILTRDPLGNETRYRYDGAGNRTAMVDAEGIETRYNYDNLDRLTSVVGNYGDGVFNPAITDEDVQTEFGYDQIGNRTVITDARGFATTYVYNDLNQRLEARDPLGNTTHYGYDTLGRQTVITDANGDVTHFDYNAVNQLTHINYPTGTPDVTFTYDQVGNRLSMLDGTGTTTYTYDSLYRLTGVKDGAGYLVGYDYDDVGNRTHLIYPNGQVVTYTYDGGQGPLGNRLETVTDWKNRQFGYTYDDANRLTGLTLPNGVASSYGYDEAGRLILLAHETITESLASYTYSLDNVGNRTTLTETLLAMQPISAGAYLESEGLVVLEAENGQVVSGTTHAWLTSTAIHGYTGTAYLHVLPDIDQLYTTATLTDSPKVEFAVNFTTPGTYTVWARGYAGNASADSLNVSLNGQTVNVTGFAPEQWDWANTQSPTGEPAALSVTTGGLYTLTVSMREDGLRLDRLLLTTDTTSLPTGFGPAASEQQAETSAGQLALLDHTIVYRYDHLYRLTEADYSTRSAGSGQASELYEYAYDPVGNRLQQIINGDTTEYLYDAASRLEAVDGQPYAYDDNGNLLATGVMTNTWDAANRLIETSRDDTTLQPIYDGVGNRVAQTVGATTTTFALDVGIGLPEVIQTSEGNSYLHLPGVIVAENATGEIRYLLSDGLGSIRQVVDESGAVVDYNEFDPYGNPLTNHVSRLTPYGYTGEWWNDDLGLLYLRARWYLPQDGVFLSRDLVESEPAYLYGRGNPVNRVDPSGLFTRDVILRSLNGKSIEEAFAGAIDGQGRAGLYWLLLDAKDGDAIWPTVVTLNADPNGRDTLKYPLTADSSLNPVIRCNSDQTLSFNYMSSLKDIPPTLDLGYSDTLPEFLNSLEIAANRRMITPNPWRAATSRYHYYARSKAGNNDYTFYDDFGDMTEIPDVLGMGFGATPLWGIVGGSGELLIDRFGQVYFNLAGVGSYGVPISLRYREGYISYFAPFIPNRGSPRELAKNKNEDILAEVIADWGYDVGGGIIIGSQFGQPLPPKADIAWFSVGFDLGVGVSVGYTFGPIPNLRKEESERWGWVDIASEGYSILSLGFVPAPGYTTPGNECDCSK